MLWGTFVFFCNRSSTDKTTRWHNEVTTDVTQFAFTHGGQVRANVILLLWTSSVFSFLNFWPTKELIIFSTSDISPRLYHTIPYILYRTKRNFSCKSFDMVAAQVILCHVHVTELLTMHFPVILSPSCQPHHDITWILLSVSLCKRELWQSWMFRGCSCDYVPLQISCFWKPNKLQLGNVTCSLFVYCDMSLLTWHVRIRYYIVLSLLKVVIKGKIISTSGLTLKN
jgi:hypothetical protein